MADIREIFWDNIPADGEWHNMELNVKIQDDCIVIERTTHGIIVDGERVD